jgi:hypothetical protein
MNSGTYSRMLNERSDPCNVGTKMVSTVVWAGLAAPMEHVKATATFHAVAAKWLRQELVCARKLTQQRVSVGVEPCRRARRVALLVDERQL